MRGINGVTKATGVTVVTRLTGDDMGDRGIGGNGSEISGGEDKG